MVKDELDLFFDYYNKQPWHIGVTDCCLFLAAWAIWLGYEDPACRLRVQYWDEKGYLKIIKRHGGLTPLVDECVQSIGGKEVQIPIRGDIGVIGSPLNLSRQFGAIFDGNVWRVRHVEKIGFMSASTLAMWRI